MKTLRLGTPFCALFLLSCSHGTPARLPASSADLAALEVRPGQEVFWGGSPEAEKAQFKEMGERIREIIRKQTEELRGQPPQRGFHAKSQGCLAGSMILDPARPAETRQGIFASEYQQWNFWGRFSNGAGWHDSDTAADIHGLALKVVHVPGPKLMEEERTTQDFIMISTPVGFGKDADVFMNFAEMNARHTGAHRQADLLRFSVHNPSAGRAIRSGLNTVLGDIPSLAKVQYWSGTPYRLGADRVMKYTVKPLRCPQYPEVAGITQEQWQDPEKFRKELENRATTGFCMGMYVQLQTADVKKTPIENGSKEWELADAPLIRVATLEFLPQAAEHTRDMCDKMVFNPWHAIPAHQPLGHQNRARRWVYHSSRETRHGVNEFPTASWLTPELIGVTPIPGQSVEVGGWEIE